MAPKAHPALRSVGVVWIGALHSAGVLFEVFKKNYFWCVFGACSSHSLSQVGAGCAWKVTKSQLAALIASVCCRRVVLVAITYGGIDERQIMLNWLTFANTLFLCSHLLLKFAALAACAHPGADRLNRRHTITWKPPH